MKRRNQSRKVERVTPCAPSSPARKTARKGLTRPTSTRLKLQAIDAFATQLEHDTLLVPEWIAENVVQEAERFLNTTLPENFTARLAAKAEHLYPRHAHFKKQLNRPGNRGRDNLRMYMRHWTCAWLKRELPTLHKKLPWYYALGQRLNPVRNREVTS